MRWIKLDTGLYRNPKVRRAGRDGRDLFVLLLCLNGEHGFEGQIPASYLDPDYLAYELAMDADNARNALRAVSNAGLLTLDEETGCAQLSGWDETWSPPDKTAAARQARWRDKKPTAHAGQTEKQELGDENNGRNALRNGHNAYRSEESRLDKKRSEERERGACAPARTTEPLELELDPEPAKKARPRKPTPLEKHQALAAKLWAYQDELRAEAIPRCRPLPATDAALAMVAARLEDGYSREDCEHVLHVYAAEAKADPGQRQWFNGETNWRPENFRRSLGKDPGSARDSSHSRDLGVDGLRELQRELEEMGM